MAQDQKTGQQAGANEGGGSDPDALLRIWNDWMKSGSEQLTEHFAHDPLLKSIEQMYNSNPLHDVIPLDWAGIAWAMRTVWLRTLNRPEILPAMAGLNAAVWRSTLDIWSEAGRRWWGQSNLDPREADKRFAAPEWQSNPVYRTLKEGSCWPLTGCSSTARWRIWTTPNGGG
jgi:hypothetical protein